MSHSLLSSCCDLTSTTQRGKHLLDPVEPFSHVLMTHLFRRGLLADERDPTSRLKYGSLNIIETGKALFMCCCLQLMKRDQLLFQSRLIHDAFVDKCVCIAFDKLLDLLMAEQESYND